jgi:hypothetical protein
MDVSYLTISQVSIVWKVTQQDCVGNIKLKNSNKMTDQEIIKYGEIQYLKGRLDELEKAIPTVFNMERQRKLDQRIEKYLQKLRKVDEVSFHLYQVELINRGKSKDRSKREIKKLLEDVLVHAKIADEDLINRIKLKIDSY